MRASEAWTDPTLAGARPFGAPIRCSARQSTASRCTRGCTSRRMRGSSSSIWCATSVAPRSPANGSPSTSATASSSSSATPGATGPLRDAPLGRFDPPFGGPGPTSPIRRSCARSSATSACPPSRPWAAARSRESREGLAEMVRHDLVVLGGRLLGSWGLCWPPGHGSRAPINLLGSGAGPLERAIRYGYCISPGERIDPWLEPITVTCGASASWL